VYLSPYKRRLILNRILWVNPNPLYCIFFSIFIQYFRTLYCIVLPTVDSSFLKICTDYNKQYYELDQDRINNYIEMIKEIIENINSVGNGKPFIGMIPLIPVSYLRQLLNIYHDVGINSFIIDGGTKDVLGASEAEFRTLLNEINKISYLPQSFILASNLGYSTYDGSYNIADDFLSLFAYVDVLNSTFKSRGFKKTKTDNKKQTKYFPKARVFSKDEYIYDVYSYNQAQEMLQIPKLNRYKLNDYNEIEQIMETLNLQTRIGEENMIRFLLNKEPLLKNEIKIRRLRNINIEINI